MCDPLTIAGLALTAGSTVANTVANNRAAGARSEVLALERDRQNRLDSEAAAANVAARDRYANMEGQQAQKAVQLGDYLATAQPTAQAGAPDANATAGSVMPTATNDVVTREIGKKSNQASAFTGQQAQALGSLRAFGDLLGEIGTKQARDAGQIGQVNAFKQGSANSLPMELDAANQKGAGLRVFGDILGGLGGIATTAGLVGGKLTLPGPLFGGNSWGAAPAAARVYG